MPIARCVLMTWKSMPRHRLRRAILVSASVPVVLLLLIGASGFVVFTKAPDDPLQRADAVVVLGGEHDGREDYGITLARGGWAPSVVVSNPYGPTDAVMRRICSPPGGGIEVICLRPDPLTTRGEADMVRRLAVQRSWSKVIVVTWKYHLPRARMVFRQCFSHRADAVVMRAVPRRYDFSLVRWEWVYAYQYGGVAKTVVLGDCD